MNPLIISIVVSVGIGAFGYGLLIVCSLQDAVQELKENEGDDTHA